MKMFYSAYTCKGNTGDILINKLQIEEYARYGEVYVDCTDMPMDFCRVIFDTKNPNIRDFVKVYGINYRSRHLIRVLRLLKKEKFTHFTKSPGPYAYIKFPFKTFLIRVLGALSYFTAKSFGMKVIALGIDLNYSQAPQWLQRLNNYYFRVYYQIGIRSLKNTQQLSKALTNVMYIPDMAFLYPLSARETCKPKEKRVALSFRKVENEECLVEILKTICGYFSEKQYEIDIVYQVEEDKAMSKRLFHSIKSDSIYLTETLIDYYSLDIYKRYDFVISNRLHVLLMAAMNGSVPYGIISQNVKENKIKDIFDSVFESRLVSYLENFKCDNISAICDNQDTLRNEVKKSVMVQQSLCVKLISELFKN